MRRTMMVIVSILGIAPTARAQNCSDYGALWLASAGFDIVMSPVAAWFFVGMALRVAGVFTMFCGYT
jgi:hypothetical protein